MGAPALAKTLAVSARSLSWAETGTEGGASGASGSGAGATGVALRPQGVRVRIEVGFLVALAVALPPFRLTFAAALA